MEKMLRLDKLLADTGKWSRKDAKLLLKQGRVQVDGAVERAADRKVDPLVSRVAVDGGAVGWSQFRYLMLHKPRGYVTTLQDEKGRKTVAELVADCGVRVYPVGRLDMNSEGLLLLTNDGEWMNRLLHPRYQVDKVYHVSVWGDVDGADKRLGALRDIGGEAIQPAQVRFLRKNGQSALLEIVIHEGKNRQVRRMCDACGLTVKRLRRVREHSLELGDLPAGKWRYLTDEEKKRLQMD